MQHRKKLLSLLVLCGLAVPARSQAHGGFWRANDILIDPQSRQIYLKSDVRGLIASGADGFSWLCAEAYGHQSLSPGRVRMAIDARGSLLIAGLSGGIHVSSDGLCTFRMAEGLAGFAISDLKRHGARVLALALKSSGAPDARVFAADGSGAFAPTGEPLPRDFFPMSLGVASATGSLLAAGIDAQGALSLLRSDERGAAWEARATLAVDPQKAWNLEVVEVDERGDIAIVLADELERSTTTSLDRLYVSRDGGATLEAFFADGTALHGFARSPDGKVVMIASASGLYRAPFEAAVARAEQAFERIVAEPVYGLAWTSEGLYVGREAFLLERTGASSLDVSLDEGRTFSPVLQLCDVRARACPAESSVGARCAEVYSDMGLTGGGFYEDFLAPERCGADAGTSVSDAGVAAMSDASSARDAAGLAHDGGVDAAFVPNASGLEGMNGARGDGCSAAPYPREPRPLTTWWFLALGSFAALSRRLTCARSRGSVRRRSRD